jgi:ZIP family zinc transporter
MTNIIEFISQFHPTVQALFATLFTWGVTAAGAALVFFFKTINQRVLDSMMGFAAGVMIAASFWSLLAPAIEMSEASGSLPKWAPALIGFMSGGIFLALIDKVLPHVHPSLAVEQAEGISTKWRRSVLLVMAITLHNIPEGLAVGGWHSAPWHTACLWLP